MSEYLRTQINQRLAKWSWYNCNSKYVTLKALSSGCQHVHGGLQVLIGKNEGKETRDPTNMVLIAIKERGEA